jgi:hypothetical protein
MLAEFESNVFDSNNTATANPSDDFCRFSIKMFMLAEHEGITDDAVYIQSSLNNDDDERKDSCGDIAMITN